MNFRTDYAEIEKRLSKTKKKKDKSATAKIDKGPYSLSKSFVVVTGSLPGMTRSQVSQFISRNGGTMQSSVNTTTNFVIVGNTKGIQTTKINAAAIYRIPVVPYREVEEFKKFR